MFNLNILLVDDDVRTRQTVRMMLSEINEGQVFEQADGNEALDFLDKGSMPVDLVISDWNMPNKTGFEFLRETRQVFPSLPFIMITARADVNSVKEALGAGVTAYIRKPFSVDELQEKISAIM